MSSIGEELLSHECCSAYIKLLIPFKGVVPFILLRTPITLLNFSHLSEHVGSFPFPHVDPFPPGLVMLRTPSVLTGHMHVFLWEEFIQILLPGFCLFVCFLTGLFVQLVSLLAGHRGEGQPDTLMGR